MTIVFHFHTLFFSLRSMTKVFVRLEIAALVYSGPVREASTTGRTQLNDPCTRTLVFSFLVRPGVFFFILAWEVDFLCVFHPVSGEGNFGLPSTRIIYSSFYNRIPYVLEWWSAMSMVL